MLRAGELARVRVHLRKLGEEVDMRDLDLVEERSAVVSPVRPRNVSDP